MTATTAADLVLVPRPRSLVVNGEGPSVDCAVVERRVDGLAPEAFELDITTDGVEIRHGDDAGLRYGRATLAQIRSQIRLEGGTHLPALAIRDRPDFAVRGYMLDISRDRVPTRETLERLIELMELARINQLQLYTEHTFAYRDHEKVWRDASPMTVDDIAWLQRCCAEAGIELVPNQNCFGHMDRWLKHEPYRQWAETPDGYEPVPGMHRPPAVLAPTVANAEFALSLFAELLPNFSSRRVHIGCDETFELGLGVSRQEAERVGKQEVFARHLERLVTPLCAEGREVLFWDDIIRKKPSVLERLPAEAVAVAWTYEGPKDPSNIPHAPAEVEEMLSDLDIELTGSAGGFAPIIEPLAQLGRPFWVAPGTSSWNSLIGRIDNAIANLTDAAVTGRAYGASGYLITDWGDGGHLQPPSISFGPLLFGGAVSWCVDANRDLALAPVLDRFVFGGAIGESLATLGGLSARTGRLAYNGSPLDAVMGRGATSFVSGDADASQLVDVVAVLDEAIDALPRIPLGCADAALVGEELMTAARLARQGAWRLLERAGGKVPDVTARRADLAESIALQRECWLARSRPGGLPDSIARLERVLAGYGT